MTLSTRQYDNDIISLDLSSSRSSSAQGLTKKINSLTVITLDGGALSVKLNSSTSDSITLSDGSKIEGIPITELYWTNAAQSGKTAEISVVWVD